MVLSLLKQKRGGCVPMWLVLIRRQQHQGHLGPIASRSHLPHAQLVGIDQACERVACKGGNAQNFMHQRVSASPQHRQRRHLDNDVLIRPDGRCSPRTGIKGQGCQADGGASLPSCWHRSRLQCGARDAGAQLGTLSDVPAKPIWFAATGTATNGGTLAAVMAGQHLPHRRAAWCAPLGWRARRHPTSGGHTSHPSPG